MRINWASLGPFPCTSCHAIHLYCFHSGLEFVLFFFFPHFIFSKFSSLCLFTLLPDCRIWIRVLLASFGSFHCLSFYLIAFGFNPMAWHFCGHMIETSAESEHQEGLLVIASWYMSLAQSVLLLAHLWMEEAKAVTDWKPALPSQLPNLHRALLKQYCSFWPVSHSFSLRFTSLKVNGVNIKKKENLHWRLVRERWTSEQEKQKRIWHFFQVSCPSQSWNLPLTPENIFTRKK